MPYPRPPQAPSWPLLSLIVLLHVRRVCSDMPSSLLATHEFKLLPSGLLALTLRALSCCQSLLDVQIFQKDRAWSSRRDVLERDLVLDRLSKLFVATVISIKPFYTVYRIISV